MSRIVLYHIIRTSKPTLVVEIGTYFCGTAEVLARALWENGFGQLITIDPFGAERCPGIIASWPAALQRYVHFSPANSMSLMMGIEERAKRIGVAFIDGNHEYEYAAFDIACCARFMEPGGYLVIDNIEQTGPYFAACDFLNAHPGWTEIGESLTSASDEKPFETDRLGVLETSLIILRAPMSYIVAGAPISTGQIRYPESRIAIVGMQMSESAPPGTLHAQVILRGFASGAAGSVNRFPEQLIATHVVQLNGDRSVKIQLDLPLQTNDRSSNHTSEIVLLWSPDRTGQFLSLERAPEPYPG